MADQDQTDFVGRAIDVLQRAKPGDTIIVVVADGAGSVTQVLHPVPLRLCHVASGLLDQASDELPDGDAMRDAITGAIDVLPDRFADPADHFADAGKMVELGSGSRQPATMAEVEAMVAAAKVTKADVRETPFIDFQRRKMIRERWAKAANPEAILRVAALIAQQQAEIARLREALRGIARLGAVGGYFADAFELGRDDAFRQNADTARAALAASPA